MDHLKYFKKPTLAKGQTYESPVVAYNGRQKQTVFTSKRILDDGSEFVYIPLSSTRYKNEEITDSDKLTLANVLSSTYSLVEDSISSVLAEPYQTSADISYQLNQTIEYVVTGQGTVNVTNVIDKTLKVSFDKNLTEDIKDIDGSFVDKDSNITIDWVGKQLCNVSLNRKIYYTSSDGNTVTPTNIASITGLEGKELTIVQNICESGEGCMIFDDDIYTLTTGAFAGCNTLKSITLPETITELSNSVLIEDTVWDNWYSDDALNTGVFEECTKLKTVNLGKGITSIGIRTFYNCIELRNINIPDSVTEILTGAFYKCSHLKSITLPDSIETLGTYIFYRCTHLVSCNIPTNITYIPMGMFFSCEAMTSYIIPEYITCIDECAFANCSNLISVLIGSNVQEIYYDAFGGCYQLSYIYSLPMTAPTITQYTFGSHIPADGNYMDGYTGYEFHDMGINTLEIQKGATGYNEGYWLDPLQNVDKCGFNLVDDQEAYYYDLNQMLTFYSPEDGSAIRLDCINPSTEAVSCDENPGDVYYSLDGVNFNYWNAGDIIELNSGEFIYVYGNNQEEKSYEDLHIHFSMSGHIEAGGNIMSLVNLNMPDTIPYEGYFAYMFYNCEALYTAPLLPATNLSVGCYFNMFNGCTNLNTFFHPDNLYTLTVLPATTLTQACYGNMFTGCSSLTTAPELPATNLTRNCYNYMFLGCTSLNYIYAIFLTTPSDSYTVSWVSGVASSGTFVKNSAATWNVTGDNGIPSGWTVKTD